SFGAAASRRLSLRQGQRRVDRRKVQGVWARYAYRILRRALPDAERAAGRIARLQRREWNRLPGRIYGKTRRAQPARRSYFQPKVRAVANLQRVFKGWRRHRAPRLRKLRDTGGLRSIGKAGCIGEGGDRNRALRAFLARHQAQGCRGARRDRLPDLLRSSRRRLFSRRDVSRRRL